MFQKIKQIKRTNQITIEQLYGLGSIDMGSTISGHESVNCPYGVMNITKNGEKYYGKVKRVIRHKVSKPKWRIEDGFRNEVFVTNDHSIMVVRDGVLTKIKPFEVDVEKDLLVSIDCDCVKTSAIKECKCVGEFDNEFVYDIEMEDSSHTFVANNILVHNSVYSQLDEVIRTTDWCIGDSKSNWQMSVVKNGKKEVHWYCGARSEEETRTYFDSEGFVDYELTRVKGEAKDFALAIDDVVLADFFKRIFEEYAKKLNTKNYLVFELETYSDAGIWLAKKKYIQNIRWTDDLPKDEIREKYSAIKAKGIEMIQPSSPAFARKKIKEAVRWIFSHDNFTMDEFVTWLDGVRKEFELANIEDICWNKKCTGYSQYVVNDTDKIEVRTKTPANVKAIALYNFLLNNKPQFKGKYNMMRGGEKCKIYYCLPTREAGKDYDMFAFEPGIRPDFAPAVDKRTMFEKSIIDPINRILGVLPNATEVTYDMMLMKTLF